MKKFELGDPVKWRSQAQGVEILKRGVVVAVVPFRMRPDPEKFPDLYKSGCGYGREDEESYIVRVDRGPKAKAKHYWPRVKHLELDMKG